MILKPAWMASSPVVRLLVAGPVVAVPAGIVAARPSIGARATTSPTAPTA